MDSTDSSPPPPKKLNQVMNDIFDSKDGADVTFVVHGKELHAHKIILVNRSPVFKAMIEGPMAHADQRYEINDPEITYEDLENFLKFLYTDECDMQESNFKTLIYLGSFYDVPYLLEERIKRMDFLKQHNVFGYAELIHLYSPTLLQKSIGTFFALNGCDGPLAYRDGKGRLKLISAELVLEIVKQCPRTEKVFTEDKLFKKVFKWANHVRLHQNQPSTPENLQAILAPIMPHFEPQKFSPLTLATTVKQYKLLPPEQLNEYLSEQIIKAISADGKLSFKCGDRNVCTQDRSYRYQGYGPNGFYIPPPLYVTENQRPSINGRGSGAGVDQVRIPRLPFDIMSVD